MLEELHEEILQWRRIGPLGKAYSMAGNTQDATPWITDLDDLSGGVLLKRDNATQRNSCNNLRETFLRSDIWHEIKVYVGENRLLAEDTLRRKESKLLEKVQIVLSTFRVDRKVMDEHQATLTHHLPLIDLLVNPYRPAVKDNRDNRIAASRISITYVIGEIGQIFFH